MLEALVISLLHAFSNSRGHFVANKRKTEMQNHMLPTKQNWFWLSQKIS